MIGPCHSILSLNDHSVDVYDITPTLAIGARALSVTTVAPEPRDDDKVTKSIREAILNDSSEDLQKSLAEISNILSEYTKTGIGDMDNDRLEECLTCVGNWLQQYAKSGKKMNKNLAVLLTCSTLL